MQSTQTLHKNNKLVNIRATSQKAVQNNSQISNHNNKNNGSNDDNNNKGIGFSTANKDQTYSGNVSSNTS